MLGKTQKTVRGWRKRYEVEGLDGLLSIRSGRGLKSRLLDVEAFEQDLNDLGDKKRGGRIRAQDVVDMIYEKYGISYSQSGMYHVLERFGFSWITSRSKHPKHNKADIEAFKKTL
jgi:transposase